MARQTQVLVLSPWVGGLNSSHEPIVLGQTPEGQQALVQADNIVFTNSGGRVKRGGQARFNSTAMNDGSTAASAVDGIYATTYWRNASSTQKSEELVVVADSGRVFYGASYGTLTALTSTTVTPTFSHGMVSSEVMNEDLFIGYSKTATALWYEGGGANYNPASASTSIVGTFPNGWLVRQHLNRLWVAGDGTNPDRLYYSAADLPFAYGTAGGFIDVYPGDGDPNGITAIFPSNNVRELYVAKRQAIYKIDTSDLSPSNWAVVPVSKALGCVSHNSVAPVDQGEVFFASDRGIHSLGQVLSGTAVLEGQFLSDPIQDQYDEIASKNAISGIWAPDLNSYLFSCQREGETQFECIFGYNVQLQAWYRWTNVPCNFLFKRLVSSSYVYQYYTCGDSTSSSDRGFINKLQQSDQWDFSSSTGNISAVLKTPIMYPGGDIINEKAYLNLIFLTRAQDDSAFEVQYTIDELAKGSAEVQQRSLGGNILGNTSAYLLGSTFILGSPSGVKPLFAHIAGVGNAIQVTITHDTIDSGFEIYGFGIEYSGAGESQNAYRVLNGS